MNDSPEHDWKHMRALQKTLLNRLSERFNKEFVGVLQDSELSQHERYLKTYSAIHEADKDVSAAFDDWRRSTITHRIAEITRLDLFTEEDIQGFSSATRERIELYRSRFNKNT